MPCPFTFTASQAGLKAIEMWWLGDVVVPAVLIVGVYCFVWLVRDRSRKSTRRSKRTAEDLYPQYADSVRKQRRYAKKHGGSWRDDGSPAA
jgi:hypothetical protein